MNKNIILTPQKIELIIKRIAYQIYETYIDDSEIVVAGIENNGAVLAEKIAKELEKISDMKILYCNVKVNKKNPEFQITTSLPVEEYANKGLILIDDVLHSGATLIYAVKYFLDTPLKKFKTAVLIDRNHKKYPIKADFKGISLSTSLLEDVQVVFEPNNQNYAYLR